MALSAFVRNEYIQKLKDEEFDLLIIGGGINGAGVARDAASRGMKVALVEADDYASGTSSRSSKLIHGGIRYLENYEFGLVFEALRERRNLFSMAPHLVHPLRFILPIYKDSRVGMFLMGLGMWLYDLLSMFEAPQMHERLSANETLRRVPMLNQKELCGSYVYSDAYMDDDRLVIETLRSADSYGATSVNFVKATGAKFANDKLQSVECEDVLKGEKFHIRAKHFISTVGPWTDIVGNQLLGSWKNIMRPSKGIHLTLPRGRAQLDDAVVMVSSDQKRVVFGIPRHEMSIFGTTDTDFEGDPKNVHTQREDVDYVLDVVDQYFPGAEITESDIMASYSGVRPLVNDGSESESKTSREHVIINDPRNITFLAGGKYTTYRQMAEDTIESVLGYFNLEDQNRFAQTQSLQPLNPKVTTDRLEKARRTISYQSKQLGVHPKLLGPLVDRHGEEAFEVVEKFEKGSLWQLEARHAIHETMCLSLKDFYLRRTPLVLAQPDNGLAELEDIIHVFQQEFQWDESQVTQQISDLKEHFNLEMAWRNKTSS